MIDEEMTVRMFGYTSDMLAWKSNKKIVVMCDECGISRIVEKSQHRDLCKSCSRMGNKHWGFGKKRSDEVRKKIGDANKNPSVETRQKIGDANRNPSVETRKKMSEAGKNRAPCSEETRKKMSEARKGKKRPKEAIHKTANANRGKKRSDEARQRMSEAQKGKTLSEETRKKISESGKIAQNRPEVKQRNSLANKGNKRALGFRHSEETRKMMSEIKKGKIFSEDHRKKISETNKGRTISEEARKKSSATQQGISYDEWESFATEQKYCPRFNNACRESNREKYGRRCFLSGKPESENITKNGKVHKLSVHHVDMNKMQGCDGNRWRLVPLSKKYHGLAHSELWGARITWLLNNVWG